LKSACWRSEGGGGAIVWWGIRIDMTLREKVITGVTAVAVAGWGLGYLLSGRGGGEGEVLREPVMDAEAFAARTQAGLDAVRLTLAERSVLDTARTVWTGKPFASSAGQPVRAAAGAAVIASYTYSAFVQSSGQRFAIINGREYRVNDTLADGAGVVEVIEADHVVLRLTQDGKKQVIPFKKPVLKGE